MSDKDNDCIVNKCENCPNHGFLICDTNFIVFIMNYIYQKTEELFSTEKCLELRDINELEYFLNRDYYYLMKLKRFLTWICKCSVNKKINITNRLFAEMNLNYFHNTLSQECDFLRDHPNNYKTRKVAQMIRKYFRRSSVNRLDLEKIKDMANYMRHSPGYNDISLIILALRESNRLNKNCIIITEDMDLRSLIENRIIVSETFESTNRGTLRTDKILIPPFLEFLSKIYLDCRFNDIEEILDFYEDFLIDFLPDLTISKLKKKVRIGFKVVAEVSNNINLKENRRGANV